MNPTVPVPVPASGKSRRRVWFWAVGIFLSSFVLIGAAAVSFLTLDRDAAALRRHVMRATDSEWTTRIQFSVGRLTLGTLRTALGFVHGDDDLHEARLALRAVNRASVGIYELASGSSRHSSGALLAETDRAMQKRGWSRLVGITGGKETVLIYADDDRADGDPIALCLAVVQARKLVVVSTSVDASALGELLDRHLPGEVMEKLRHPAHHVVPGKTPAVVVPTAAKAPQCVTAALTFARVPIRTIHFGMM